MVGMTDGNDLQPPMGHLDSISPLATRGGLPPRAIPPKTGLQSALPYHRECVFSPPVCPSPPSLTFVSMVMQGVCTFRGILGRTQEDLLPAVYLCTNQVAPSHVGTELGIGDAILIKVRHSFLQHRSGARNRESYITSPPATSHPHQEHRTSLPHQGLHHSRGRPFHPASMRLEIYPPKKGYLK